MKKRNNKKHFYKNTGSSRINKLFFLKTFSLFIAIRILKIIYFLFKIITKPVSRVVFLSRQDNDISLDYKLIISALMDADKDLEIKVICCKLEKESPVRVIKCILDSMWFLSTSRVCVVDSYWPTVSVLNHKSSLKVIQLWHSIGKIKKSGIAAVGKESGRFPIQAKLLKMHENYDYIIAGGKRFNRFYLESFGVDESKIKNYGLPRIDYVISKKNVIRNKFFSDFPDLKGKKIVLYAPTFRTYEHRINHLEEITNAVSSYENICLLIRGHPVNKKDYEKRYDDILSSQFSTLDLLCVTDYLITDYSAISLEAAALDVKTFFWTYDYEEYDNKNGLNINLKYEVSSNLSEDINLIMERIDNDCFGKETFNSFKNKYIYKDVGKSTTKICNLIMELMNI